MTRQQVKYLLARLRAHAESGAELPEIPEGFRESFSRQVHWKGWINYHVSWDVADDDHWVVVSRAKSQEQEWNEDRVKVIPVITPEGEIVSAEEWEARSPSTPTPS